MTADPSPPAASSPAPDPAPGPSGCTCSPTGGTCARCRRRHRIAYGLVGAVAAVTLAAWLVVWFVIGQ